MPVDFSPAALAAAAGVDPWALRTKLAGADPDVVRAAGRAFRQAGAAAGDIAQQGRVADATSAEAFVNNGAGVYDTAGARATSRTALSGDGESMEETARVLMTVGAGLQSAKSGVDRRFSTMVDELNAVIAARNAFVTGAGRHLTQEDLDAADRGYQAEAVGCVRSGGRAIQADLDDYNHLLSSRIGYLNEIGGTGRLTTPVAPVFGSLGVPTPARPWLGYEGGTGFVPTPDGPVIDLIAPAPGMPGATGTGTGPAPDLWAVLGRQPGVWIDSAETEEDLDAPPPRPGAEWPDTAPGSPTPPAAVVLPAGNRGHILYGEGTGGGGHLHDSDVPNKTTFPESWDTERIIASIEDVARRPDTTPTWDADKETWTTKGTRDGVTITAYVSPQGEIRTGFPTGGSGVHVNDEKGEPRPWTPS